MTLASSNMDLKTSVLTTKTLLDTYPLNDKEGHLTSSSFTSLRSILIKYFQRNRTTKTADKTRNSLCTAERKLLNHDVALKRPNSNENYRASEPRVINASLPKGSLSSSSNRSQTRSIRQKTTATFTGQKRNTNETTNIGNRLSNDLVFSIEEEQHLVRTRLSTRTSSLPAARCVSYYYYQPHTPSKTVITKAIIEDQHRDVHNNNQRNSLTPARSRSHSHSSARCVGNGMIGAIDTDHSSSFDNALEDEHQRSNRRAPPSHTSASYNSSRYSQRAIAQFMHERHKARLRRNQKASRMLGKNR